MNYPYQTRVEALDRLRKLNYVAWDDRITDLGEAVLQVILDEEYAKDCPPMPLKHYSLNEVIID